MLSVTDYKDISSNAKQVAWLPAAQHTKLLTLSPWI
jgi:hypothetical protein